MPPQGADSSALYLRKLQGEENEFQEVAAHHLSRFVRAPNPIVNRKCPQGQEKNMTFKTWSSTIALTLFAALVLPSSMTAQKDAVNSRHHHYQLVKIPTLGGPQSYFNRASGYDITGHSSLVNRRGTVAGFADTSMPDPFPNFCFNADCYVSHAFKSREGGGETDLGALPGGASSASLWISANGFVAGVSENGETDPLFPGLPEFRAVLWRHGSINDLGTLPEGGYESEANAVNSSGQVVGAALNTVPDSNSMAIGTYWLFGLPYGYQTRAFLWDNEMGMQDLGTLPGGTDAQAILINDRGQVVGYSYNSSPLSGACFPLATSTFLWEKGKGMVDLGGFGGTCTLAADLNNQGQVVGFSTVSGDQFEDAFLWEHGSIHSLGGSLGGTSTGAFAINDAGQAVGFGTLAGDTSFHAAFWRQVGKITDLGVVGSDQCSYAATINARGQIAGSSISICNSDSATFRAVLWEDGSIFDLNTLIRPDSRLYLSDIFTLNDRGEMAGQGVDASGNAHAFLLIPCDENHPDVAGCDYSLVDEAVATSQSAASVMQKPVTSRAPVLYGPVNNVGRMPRRRPGPLSQLLRPITTSEGDQEAPISRNFEGSLDDKIAVHDRDDLKDKLWVNDDADGRMQKVPLCGTGVAGSCVPIGGACFGPGGSGHPRCCPAPFPHHSICTNRTGWGRCVMT
jgi:probable HAF family extracellular repeat protein